MVPGLSQHYWDYSFLRLRYNFIHFIYTFSEFSASFLRLCAEAMLDTEKLLKS